MKASEALRPPLIRAHIANLAKYNAGVLRYVPLNFPTDTETVQNALRYIGVDGLRYESTIILDYESQIPGFRTAMSEYANIDEINYLAVRYAELTDFEKAMFQGAAEHGEYADSLKDLINLTYNLGCYDLLPDVSDAEAYGYWLVDEAGSLELSETIRLYFDFESYGETTATNEGGVFTAAGYTVNNQSEFKEIYDGWNVPSEYRVFKYPLQPAPKKHETDRAKGGHDERV